MIELETVAGLLVASLAGGAFGAAVGALPAFTLTGLLVVVGEVYALIGRTVTEIPALDITGALAFGPLFGPHVSFAGGAAAVAYAAREGYLDETGQPYDAKAVDKGLGARWDLLAVGAIFGAVGESIAIVAGPRVLTLPLDPVALGVVGSALAHRAVLGYSVLGQFDGGVFDMSSHERDIAPDGGRTVDPWLPYQYQWGNVAALGLAVGALGGYLAYLTGSAFLGFGLSTVALVYINAGTPDIPVTHHVTLPASTAVLALAAGSVETATPGAVSGAMSPLVALGVGAVFGLLGAVLGEGTQRLLYAHAETHLDPPAASIVLTSLLVGVLAMVGVLPGPVWVPQP